MIHFRNIAKKFLLIPALTGLVASPVISVLQTSPAFANSYDQMSALGKIKLHDGLNMLEGCESDGEGGGGRLVIPSGHGSSVDGEWVFSDSSHTWENGVNKITFTLPAYYENSDRSIGCKDIFTSYSGVFGITDTDSFLDDAGFSEYSATVSSRTWSGTCGDGYVYRTELSCLRKAIIQRVANYQADWDAHMYYTRNKAILDARVGGSDPGGCFAHWTSQTTSGVINLDEWLGEYGRGGDDGILGTQDSPTVIKLVNNSTAPTGTTDYFVMSEGGDGSAGWKKEVYTSIAMRRGLDISTSDGNPVMCKDLALALNNKFTDEFKAWYTAWKIEHPGEDLNTGPGTQDAETTASTCAIAGIGWIVCPVMTFLGGISDFAYGFIADSFLKVDVGLVSTTLPNNGGVNPTYSTWQTFRNIANVLFVIVFLIIVFSQLTSAGISNYGVKKMLPRLVIAAILVNASYFIAQIAVDISNILGYSIKSLFETLPIYTSATISTAEVIGQGLTWTVVIGAALVAGVALLLAISMPVLLAAVLSVLMIVLILIGRQALIVLLIILSPIAFVAWLLPNTEQYFKKWWKMFFTLLMVFPVIGVLFGASKLAATVLQAVGAGNGNELMQVIAMGVATIPLIMTPSLLKGALSATGSLGAKLSGISSKLNSQVGGKVKSESRLGEAMKNRQINNIRNRAARRTRSGGLHLQSKIDNSNVGRKLGFRAGAARAAQITDAADQEEMKNAQGLWEKDGTGSDFDKLEGIVNDKGVSSIEGRAALAMLAAKGGASQVQRIRNGDKEKDIRSQKGADFDRTIAPYFSALKAKDYRAVGLHEGGDRGTGLLSSVKAADMHTMTDDALLAGAQTDSSTFDSTFRATLRAATSDPEQARFFSADILERYGGGSTAVTAPATTTATAIQGAPTTAQSDSGASPLVADSSVAINQGPPASTGTAPAPGESSPAPTTAQQAAEARQEQAATGTPEDIPFIFDPRESGIPPGEQALAWQKKTATEKIAIRDERQARYARYERNRVEFERAKAEELERRHPNNPS